MHEEQAPSPEVKIDWAESVILRLRRLKEYIDDQETKKKVVFRELVLTITGDDETCFMYRTPETAELWRMRLVVRLQWEINELLKFGSEHQDIIKLLSKALNEVKVQNWATTEVPVENSAWKTSRDQIYAMEKVQNSLGDREVEAKTNQLFKVWQQEYKSRGYKLT